MELLDLIALEDKKEYECYSVLKSLLNDNESFRKLIEKGIEEGKIRGFDSELWKKIANQNIRRLNSFEDVFIEGANIGYCTVAVKQLSYSLETCYICGGILPLLKGTKNCEDGSHTWLLYKGEIIDTTLMIIIKEGYAKSLGYAEENRYNPNTDSVYLAAKNFTNDEDLRKR